MIKLYKGLRTMSIDIDRLAPTRAANGAYFYMTEDLNVAKRYGNHILCIEVEEGQVEYITRKIEGMDDAVEVCLDQRGLTTLLTYAWSITVDGVEL